MNKALFIVQIVVLCISTIGCVECKRSSNSAKLDVDSVKYLEMKFGVQGVESDVIPYIDTWVDFEKRKGSCKIHYGNPRYRDSMYSISVSDIDSLERLINAAKLDGLKNKYSSGAVDVPNSTIIITTTNDRYSVYDYGLVGDPPLLEMYRIAYRLDLYLPLYGDTNKIHQ